MFNLDQHVQLAWGVTKSFTDASNTAMESALAFWTGGRTENPGRSWYKAPVANPFDVRSWMPSGSSTGMPWAFWGSMMLPPDQSAMQSWFGGTSATGTNPMNPWAPLQNMWLQALSWPMQSAEAFTKAAQIAPVDFSTYRSTGGHASATIKLAPPSSKLH